MASGEEREVGDGERRDDVAQGSRRPFARALRRLRQDRSAMLGLALCCALAGFALLVPFFAGDPLVSDFDLARSASGAPPGPSGGHLLGTDPLFRDLLARLAVGARTSLFIGTGATVLALGCGVLVGLVAGMCEGETVPLGGRRRWALPLSAVDTGLMRLCDVALAFPFLLLVTAVGAAVGRSGALGVVAILGLTGWTGVARLVRSKTMVLKRQGYVLAARALGARRTRIGLRHIAPGLTGTLLVIGSQALGAMILAEAVLGYLTLGLDPPTPSWGRMLHEAEGYLGLDLGLVAAPGLCILLAVLGFNRLAEGIQDAIEPRRTPTERRALPADLFLALGLFLLVAAAKPHTPAPPLGEPAPAAVPARGGWLRLATSVDIRSLDPALAYDEAATAVDSLLFAGLVRYDEDGTVVPDLAESFEVLGGGQRYRFALRRGLTFHDAAPLRADDVKRSLERALGPASAGPAQLYSMIAGFQAFRDGEAPALVGVRVLDAYHLEVELDAPRATFLPLMTLGFAAPVCPSMGPSSTRPPPTPCGAGPFRLATWERGAHVRVSRFEGYHERGVPYLDGVEWLLDVPAQTQRYRFERGELDVASELGTADVQLYAADRRWQPHTRGVTELATAGVFLNTELPPFDSPTVRRAVSFALDPSVLTRLRPTVEPADRMLPPGIPGPRSRPPLRRHDTGKAAELMAEAGYAYDTTTGRGGYPNPVDYLVVPDSFEQGAAEVFQQQLARIGLRIRLRPLPFASYLAEVSRRRTAPMGWTGWHADYPHWTNFFAPTLTTAGIDATRSTNPAFFSNAALDDIVERGGHELADGVRDDLYERAEAVVQQQAPWIPLWRNRSFELVHPYVMDYRRPPLGRWLLARTWIAPSGRDMVGRMLGPPGVDGAER